MTVKLLVVDDSAEMRRLIRSVLSDLVTEFAECADGQDAVESYGRFGPDWVLMDIEMPVVDGLTATRAIKSAYPSARIVILTQHDGPELRHAAAEAGACDYVSKETLGEVRRLLGSGR